MNHWNFVIAAYAITLAGTLLVTWWTYRSMCRAEARAEALRNER